MASTTHIPADVVALIADAVFGRPRPEHFWFEHIRRRDGRNAKKLRKQLRKNDQTAREHMLRQTRALCSSCYERDVSPPSVVSRVFGFPICPICAKLPEYHLVSLARALYRFDISAHDVQSLRYTDASPDEASYVDHVQTRGAQRWYAVADVKPIAAVVAARKAQIEADKLVQAKHKLDQAKAALGVADADDIDSPAAIRAFVQSLGVGKENSGVTAM